MVALRASLGREVGGGQHLAARRPRAFPMRQVPRCGVPNPLLLHHPQIRGRLPADSRDIRATSHIKRSPKGLPIPGVNHQRNLRRSSHSQSPTSVRYLTATLNAPGSAAPAGMVTGQLCPVRPRQHESRLGRGCRVFGIEGCDRTESRRLEWEQRPECVCDRQRRKPLASRPVVIVQDSLHWHRRLRQVLVCVNSLTALKA